MSGPSAFVMGWPVAHSRSPLIHRFWLKRHGVPGDYRREAVPPEGADRFLRGFAAMGYVGGNVTVPYKEQAFLACDCVSPTAERLRAVNTLWRDGDALHGDNTDVHGFSANLDDQAPDWRGARSALVLGAGGAARAVICALIDAGIPQIRAANRTALRAQALTELFGPPVRAHGLDELPALLSGADLVINTTSAGMAGQDPLPIDWTAARPGATAVDIVYVPLVTPFLAAAATRGLRTVDGLGMLLHQAAPGFQRWFGIRPTVDAALRALVIADLG